MYHYFELGDDAKEKASEEIHQAEFPYEDWEFHSKMITEEVLYQISNKTNQTPVIEWENIQGNIRLTKFVCPFGNELYLKNVSEQERAAYNDMNNLPGFELHDDEGNDKESSVCYDYYDTEDYVVESLNFIVKHQEQTNVNVKKIHRALRFELRMGHVSDIDDDLLEIIQEALIDIWDHYVKSFNDALYETYNGLRELAANLLNQKVDYLESVQKYKDELDNGGYSDRYFMIDGSLAGEMEVEKLECDECGKMCDYEREIAQTEKEKEVNVLCKTCFQIEKVV